MTNWTNLGSGWQYTLRGLYRWSTTIDVGYGYLVVTEPYASVNLLLVREPRMETILSGKVGRN
jgi:hypothetical protein